MKCLSPSSARPAAGRVQATVEERRQRAGGSCGGSGPGDRRRSEATPPLPMNTLVSPALHCMAAGGCPSFEWRSGRAQGSVSSCDTMLRRCNDRWPLWGARELGLVCMKLAKWAVLTVLLPTVRDTDD